MRTRSGYTLLELTVVMALLALAIGIAYPGARSAADAWAVRAARDAVAATLAGTRAAALAQRGAELLIVPESGVLLVRTGMQPRPTARLELTRDWRVTVTSPGSTADTIVIRYDAIGLGRIANRTLRFERGRAVAGITIAAYGRARRW
jgi:prepilin-type N-terminal cleavage/methylation domain-containing protein